MHTLHLNSLTLSEDVLENKAGVQNTNSRIKTCSKTIYLIKLNYS